MSFKTLIAHGTFAVVAVLCAWLLAHRVEEKKGGPTSMVLLDANKGDVQRVDYTWPKGTSTVTPTGDAEARRTTVEVARTIDAKKPDPKKPDPKKPDPKKPDPKEKDDKGNAAADGGVADAPEPEPEPAPKREEARFPGAKAVLSAIDALEPLKTRRTLGEVDAARLKEMGLEKPERTLVVTTTGGQKVTLEIGESSYGGQGRYARRQGEGVVHLLDSALVTGLEGGPDTLMEKRILLAEPEKVVGFEVRHGDKSGVFVHVDRSQAAKRFFAPKEDAATKSEEAAAVMKTLRDLRAARLATNAQPGSVVAAVAVDVEGQGKAVIEVVERIDATGHLIKTGEWLFEISETQGKELVEDLDRLLP